MTDSSVHQEKPIEDVFVVPLSLYVKEKLYLDGINISHEEIYHFLKDETEDLKTSQPSIGAFVDVYRDCEKHYDHIISIHLSGKLSGTLSSARQAEAFVNIPITFIDSQILSYPLLDLILYGKYLHLNGATVQEIEEELEKRIPLNQTYVMVGNLNQLNKSGRIKGVSYLLGSVLKIKPVFSIQDGIVTIKERVRSKKKGFQRMISYLNKALEEHFIHRAWVFHGRNQKEAQEWKESLSEQYPGIAFETCPIGTIISVHVGEEIIGISWYNQGESMIH